MKKLLSITIFTLLILNPQYLFPQSNFNINAYKQFLQSHQNMSSTDLMQMHPAGEFVDDLNLSNENVRYLDSIAFEYGLTEHELSLLDQNGFVVSERMKKLSFGEAFIDIFQRDMPVFVSTDAILHAFHISYDRILRDTELGVLIPKSKSLLQLLHSQQNLLFTKYGA